MSSAKNQDNFEKCWLKQQQILGRLNVMRRMGTLCDVQLKCDTHTFMAHRCVLAAVNNHMKALMSDTTKTTFEVQANAVAMEPVLNYIYEGTLELNSETLNPVLAVAYQFHLTDLCSLYEANIVSLIDEDNFVPIWHIAYGHENNSLQNAVIQYCRNHFTMFTEKGLINRCSARMLYFIFEKSNETPTALLQTLLHWYQHNLTGRKFILSFFLFTKLSVTTETELSLTCKNSCFHTSASTVEYFSQVLADAKIYMANDVDDGDFYENLESSESPNRVPECVEAFNFEVISPKVPVSTSIASDANDKPNREPHYMSPRSFLVQSLNRPTKTLQHTLNTRSLLCTSKEEKSDTDTTSPSVHLRWLSLPSLVKSPQLLVFALAKNKQIILQRYNLKLHVWSLPERFALPKKYIALPAIASFEDHIYLLGGRGTNFTNDVYCTSPQQFAFGKKPSMLLPRVHFGVVELENKLYALGGRNATGWLRDVECFDPLQDAWHQMAPLSEAKSAFAVTVLNNNAIYATGGLKANQTFSYTSEKYDPVTDQWTILEPIPHGRFRMGIGCVSNHVYILGGTTIKASEENNNCSFLSYNVEGDSWNSDLSSTRIFQDDQPCAATWNNQLWVLSRSNFKLNNYDPLTNNWTELEMSNFVKEWQFIKNVILLT